MDTIMVGVNAKDGWNINCIDEKNNGENDYRNDVGECCQYCDRIGIGHEVKEHDYNGNYSNVIKTQLYNRYLMNRLNTL